MIKDKNITKSMDKWEFNKNVSLVFDEMINRSVPLEELMRDITSKIVINHIKENSLHHTSILDLGTSTGKAIKDIVPLLPTTKFLGIESSTPMIKQFKNNFRYDENVKIAPLNLKEINELPLTNCGAIISCLTLQFIPIEYRQKIIKEVYNSLHKKGIFILIEKELGSNSTISNLYEQLYYSKKKENGYSEQEIRDKKLKLEGVLVPVTNEFNISLLKQAGFKGIDIYWKYLNFTGYIAYK